MKNRITLLAAGLIAIGVVAASLLISSCGGGATVYIRGNGFDPDTIEIKAGQEVTWKNEDRRNHMVMSGAPPVMTDEFVSPVLEKGDSFSHRFEEPGEYPYHDMRTAFLGTVIVKE